MEIFQSVEKSDDLTEELVREFRLLIYDYFEQHGRDLPWRHTRDPYKILVSEIMLQQTQVERVIPKYIHFVKRFPDLLSLAKAATQDVLFEWHGLGYNRRALALKKCAELIVEKFNGHVPQSHEDLLSLPGLEATAASVAAFAYDAPVVFIETNIRTVYFYYFFSDENIVKDNEIVPYLEKTLDRDNPCKWYSALMDYGVMLKKHNSFNEKSYHYRKQPPFKGSKRELRGKIIHYLLSNSFAIIEDLELFTGNDRNKISEIMLDLENEGFLIKKQNKFSIRP